MHAGVDFRVRLGRLRHAKQAVQLRQHPCQRAAVAQHADEALRIGLAQRPLELLPHPLRHQGIGFAGLDHAPHQLRRFVRHHEAEAVKARRKARHAQDAHRIFGECRRHVPQPAGGQIGLAAERIDDVTVRILGHGVDGQVAPLQVLFERHVRREAHRKAVIAAPGLALGARQGVLLAGLRVQEHRKVGPHLLEAGIDQVLRRGAHHHVVAILHRQAEQAVAHRAADQAGLKRQLHRPGPRQTPVRMRRAPRSGPLCQYTQALSRRPARRTAAGSRRYSPPCGACGSQSS